MCELTYYEGTVWYKKAIIYTKNPGKRVFIHFGAVNYRTDIYLNGKHLGSHEGGFTPFQFEITDKIQTGKNSLVVKVNNQRLQDGIPGLGFDWFNYGGITRDVNLIETNNIFIEDYHLQLKKHSDNEIFGWIKLNGDDKSQTIIIKIPELDIVYKTILNNEGFAKVSFSGSFKLWSPENPKLYRVIIQCQSDTIEDERNDPQGQKPLRNNYLEHVKRDIFFYT